MNAKAEDHSEITVGFHAVKYRAPNHAATPILSDITLEIRRGETVALLGRSGSGKNDLTQASKSIIETDSGLKFL